MKIELFRITLDTNPEDCNYHCIMCEEHSPYSNYIRDKLNGKHRRMPAEWLEKIFESAKKTWSQRDYSFHNGRTSSL